ncbi:hypothetical protein ACIBEA_06790 [Streptomyces sp. NPDC051555]|uniref:hypothetical protein n=1 Tax=Streptomyces sp. NPDC051555 TaxID=3365657 RepID=UPI00378C3520
MPDTKTLACLKRHATEFRMAVSAVWVGTAFTVVAGVMYALGARGFPELTIGMALLTTGLVMLGSGTVER